MTLLNMIGLGLIVLGGSMRSAISAALKEGEG